MSLFTNIKPGRLSLWVVVLLGVIALCMRLYTPEWGPGRMVLSWDVMGYYLYLPGAFIFDDLTTLDFANEIIATYNNSGTLYQVEHVGDNKIIKYTMGMAIGYAPFFFIGHLIASASGYATDGFSQPYQISIAIGTIIYMFLGLLVTRKVLLRFFSEPLTIALLVLVFLGTNYFQFSIYNGAMPHSFLFTMYACLLWLTIRWHEDPNWKRAAGIGAVVGMLVLVRPSEIVCVLIPLLWGIGTGEGLQNKLKLIKENYLHIVVLALAGLAVWAPQLIYWKTLSGDLLFYTYGDEGFNLHRPQILKVFFSYKNGWLVYTPMMIFAIFGLVVMWKRQRKLFWAFTFFFALNAYLISSWSSWWYAGGFGHRAFIQSYAVMLIPLGFFLQELWTKWGKVGKGLMVLPLLFVLLNIFQTWQYHHTILHHYRMTGPYYWAIFGKTYVPEGAMRLLSPQSFSFPGTEFMPNYSDFTEDLDQVQGYEQSNVPEDKWKYLSTEKVYGGESSFRYDETNEWGVSIMQEVDSLARNTNTWARLTAYFYADSTINWREVMMVATCTSEGRVYKRNSVPFDSVRIQPNEWNAFSMEMIIPESRYSDDYLKAFIWNKHKQTFFVDEFRIDVLAEKEPDHKHKFVTLLHESCEPLPTDTMLRPNIDSSYAHSGNYSYHLSSDVLYSPALTLSVDSLLVNNPDQIRSMFHVYYKEQPAAEGVLLIASIEKDGEVFEYQRIPLSYHPAHGFWQYMKLDIEVPDDLPEGAVLKTYIFNKSQEKLWIDDAVIQQIFFNTQE